MFRFLMFTVLALLLPSSFAAETLTVTVDEGFQYASLGRGLAYIEDNEHSLSFAQLAGGQDGVEWQRSSQKNLSFGYTDATYWVRFAVDNAGGEPRNLLVELGYPLLDHVTAAVYRDGERLATYELGDRSPFSVRPVEHTNLVFPVEVPSEARIQVILRVQTVSSMQMPLTVWTPQALVEHNHGSSVAHGLLYGFLSALILYHLLLFGALRDRSFLYFGLYATSVSVLLAAVDGTAFAFVWPNAVDWNEISVLVTLSASIVFSSLFAVHILQLRNSRPKFALTLYGVAALGAVALLSAFVLPYHAALKLSFLFTAISAIANMAAYIVRSYDRFPPAYFLLLAVLAASTLVTLRFLAKLDYVPSNWWTEDSNPYAVCVEFLMMAFALANRMNLDRRMREQAQQERSEAQRELLDAQIEMNERLDDLVQERTQALKEANDKLQELSITDALTGLYNRRHFDAILDQEYRRSRREQTPLAVLMLDIDHFKALNDTYGHHFGDLCLIKTADLVRMNLRRPPDVAARYGGEEFGVLLPNTPLRGALEVAENLRQSFETTRVDDDGASAGMTVSIGVASWVPVDTGQHEALVRAADAQLYRAKTGGRNRVAGIDGEAEHDADDVVASYTPRSS